MKLFIASDHAGFALKEQLKAKFPDIQWLDLGAMNEESTHYPKHAQALCEAIIDGTDPKQMTEPLGILVCGSGIGMSIQANRYIGIRAALCWNEESARLSRSHNGANVLCLASRLYDKEISFKIVQAWKETPFEGGRHTHRIEMMDADCECC